MEEKRQHERFKTDITIIKGKMLFADIVVIRDICEGGISLKANRRLNLGNEYTIRIEDKVKMIPVKGIVVWSKLSESMADINGNVIPIYTAGMKFNNNSHEIQNEIIQFIERYKNINANNLHLIFNVNDSKALILEFDKKYKVKEVNLSGMLIEGNQAPEIGSNLNIEVDSFKQEPVHITGKVTSCNLIENESADIYHDIRIEFTNISEINAEMMTKIFLTVNSHDEILQAVSFQ
ncbi:MAG: PilZ domain-containing protein [Nitrospirae bacterium]|nr:PilZ domain-containing protein [Nitrospirota bacterium]